MKIIPFKVSEALAKSIYNHNIRTHILAIILLPSKLIWFNVHCVNNMHEFPQLLTSSISGISRAMRAYLFVLGSSRKWAELTLVTPASPPIAAAFWLCDKVTAAGCHLTHGLQYLCKAESLSIVWNENVVNRHPCQGTDTLVFKLNRTINVLLRNTFLKAKYSFKTMFKTMIRKFCWRLISRSVLSLNTVY